jgi:hypothetical protein
MEGFENKALGNNARFGMGGQTWATRGGSQTASGAQPSVGRVLPRQLRESDFVCSFVATNENCEHSINGKLKQAKLCQQQSLSEVNMGPKEREKWLPSWRGHPILLGSFAAVARIPVTLSRLTENL